MRRRFLEQKNSDPAEGMEKHRFMVQSKAISDMDFDAVKFLSIDQRGKEVGYPKFHPWKSSYH